MSQADVTEAGQKEHRHARLLIALGIVVAVALMWALSVASSWADRNFVAFTAIALVALLIVLLDWLIARLGPPLWRFLSSVTRTAGGALADDPEVVKLRNRMPAFSAWLGRRFTTKSATGLYLTVTVLGAVYFFNAFVDLAVNVGLARAITHYDPQLSALVRAFRSVTLTRIFYAATLLGDPSAFIPLVAVVALLLLIWAKRREAALFVGTITAGYASGEIVNTLMKRPRPPVVYALIHQPDTFSFPSGHALASIIFATMAFLIIARHVHSARVRAGVLSLGTLGVVAVGLSRVYLGMHWPSDIWSSWMLGLGWCTAAWGGFLILERYGRPAPEWRPWFEPRTRAIVTGSVAAVAVLIVAAAATFDPMVSQITAPLPTVAWNVHLSAEGMPAPTSADIKRLPLFSEKLDGSPQEPVGLIFIGTETELTAAFTKAGWSVADAPSLSTLARVSIAALTSKPYPSGPVTPTFLGGNVQDIAFEKATQAASARQRHHTRFWKTRFTFSGLPVWVATASFDSRLEIGSAIPLPTHHIDPNIDAERNYIVKDLVASGIRNLGLVRVTGPMSGTNAQGDQFFTSGMAALLIAPR